MKRFKEGRTYIIRYITDQSLKTLAKVTKRTKSFVTLQVRNETLRVKVFKTDLSEYALPFGNYSMRPSVYAKDELKMEGDQWERDGNLMIFNENRGV